MTYHVMKINKVGHTYFAIVDNFFTMAECKQVIVACKDFNLTKVPAGVYNGWETGVQNRNIGVPPAIMYQSKIDTAFEKLNTVYRFDLIKETSHFVNEYKTGQHLDWHRDEDESVEDLFKRTPANRLSCALFLNDDFEGGNFDICRPSPLTDKTIVQTFKLKKGEMIIFPSHTWHRVNKVIKGIRKSLVGWVVGKQWQ